MGDFSLFKEFDMCPGFPSFNKMNLLHGEQTTRIISPIPPSGSAISKRAFLDVQDKKKGALLIVEQTLSDVENPKQVYAINESRYFIRGLGGFGDKGKLASLKYPKIPKDRKPDAVFTHYVRPDQAILYRLSGDRNPLHIDPSMAAKGNFPRPILHGLCFYGISARAVYEHFCGEDVENFREIQARFTSHVYPGETLIVKMYKLPGGTVAVETSTKERGKVVLTAVVTVKETPRTKL